MFYYVPLNKKYIVSMNGEDITSISAIFEWKTKPEIKEIDMGNDIYYHVHRALKDGRNKGFFNINKLLEYAIAQGDDTTELPQKAKKKIKLKPNSGYQTFINSPRGTNF